MTEKARKALAAKRRYTGTRYGGNPPDSGSAFYQGQRIAWLPVDYIECTEEQFDKILAEARRLEMVLGRAQVIALLADNPTDEQRAKAKAEARFRKAFDLSEDQR